MGPFLEGLSSMNFFAAFLIGIAFGFILEASGFSSSKKLAGLFYGYDMVVLKVFFTAGITAMIGLLFFSLFGWVNLDLVAVNPTFYHSNILGGVIMGLGFIIGGFCPGTSVCAASIGKIDAMVFIGGIFIGIFIFTEGFDLWADFYVKGKVGEDGLLQLDKVLGVSQGVVALLIVVIAVGAFFFAEWVEKKFSKRSIDY